MSNEEEDLVLPEVPQAKKLAPRSVENIGNPAAGPTSTPYAMGRYDIKYYVNLPRHP